MIIESISSFKCFSYKIYLFYGSIKKVEIHFQAYFLTIDNNNQLQLPKNKSRSQMLQHLIPLSKQYSVSLDRTQTIQKQLPALDALKQLNIKYRNEADLVELSYILKQILVYPSNSAANRHEKSNRLGIHDLIEDLEDKTKVISNKQRKNGFKFCSCCGFLLQEDQIKIRTNLDSILNLGISTFLYFRTLLSAIYLLILMLLIDSVFAVGTNILANNNQTNSLSFKVKISLATKQLNPTKQNIGLFIIQLWIGFGMICFWLLFLIYLEGVEKRKILRLKSHDNYSPVSAADFTIQINNVPKCICKDKLQAYFDEYKNKIQESSKNFQDCNVDFKIAKFNVGRPFYLNQKKFEHKILQTINDQYEEKLKQFIKWVLERKDNEEFTQLKQVRDKEYQQFKTLKEQRFLAYKLITDNIIYEFEGNSNQQVSNTLFVTFTTNEAKNLILQLNEYKWTAEMRDRLLFCCNHNRLKIENNSGGLTNIQIIPAPEPEDIIWVNLGRSFGERTKRRLVTFIITLLLLLLSFFIVLLLTLISMKYMQKNNIIMSYVISLVISIFNIVIQQTIRLLTLYQRNQSQTKHQTSLAVKTVFALLTNSILIPILATQFLKISIYKQDGLIAKIFTLSITNAFLSPVVKIFNPFYFYLKIRKNRSSKPQAKLGIRQKQLNEYYSRMDFQAGYQYVYVINIYLFTCFFVRLQPIIPSIAILGLISMYWAQKYSLFYRCKRPVPGNTHINTIMFQFIYLGPVFYTLGSIIWSSYFPKIFFQSMPIPHLLSIIASGIILLFPYQKFLDYMYRQVCPVEILYEDKRIFLPSQYDRLNPATSEKAIKEYIQYIRQYKKILENKSQEEINFFEQNFFRQIMKGTPQNSNFLSVDQTKKGMNPLKSIFANTQNNIPFNLIGLAVLPQSKVLKPVLDEPVQKCNTTEEPMNIFKVFLNKSNGSQQDLRGGKKQFVDDILKAITPGINFNENPYSNIFRLSKSFESKNNQ